MTETDVAYAAGILDGEGSITLVNNGTWRRVYVAVDSTDKELIDWLKSNFGGYVVSKKKYKAHHSQAWTWRLTSRAAADFLRSVLPYLRIERKQQRAELAIRYADSTTGGGHYAEAQKTARRALEEEFCALFGK